MLLYSSVLSSWMQKHEVRFNLYSVTIYVVFCCCFFPQISIILVIFQLEYTFLIRYLSETFFFYFLIIHNDTLVADFN